MYRIYFRTKTRHDFRDTETLWAANLIAYKYVKNWGWDTAEIVSRETGEILKTYTKGWKPLVFFVKRLLKK